VTAGFAEVLMFCAEAKTLKGLQKEAVAVLDAQMLAKVRFMTADPFPQAELLEILGTSTEETVRGYKVKMKRRAVEERDAESRKRAISEVMGNATSKKD
jgi:hypothetical protein